MKELLKGAIAFSILMAIMSLLAWSIYSEGHKRSFIGQTIEYRGDSIKIEDYKLDIFASHYVLEDGTMVDEYFVLNQLDK